MHVPTWEGGLYPLRPESPHCPGGSAPPTPPMARPGGEGALPSDWQGGWQASCPRSGASLVSRDGTSGAALATGRRALGVLSIHDDALARDALTYTSFAEKKIAAGTPVTKLFHGS